MESVLEIVEKICELVIFPLLVVFGKYIISFLQAKRKEIEDQQKNKYLDFAAETIIDCVKSTNQTYVDSLKLKGEFTEAAQKEAFQRSYEKIMSILGERSKTILGDAVGDLKTYIEEKIEAAVTDLK